MPQPQSLLDPEVMNDPYPFYRWLRSTAPVYWDEPMRAWLVSRYDDVVALAHDPRASSMPPRGPDRAPRPQLLETLTGKVLMWNDPPARQRLRGLTEKAFFPLIDRTPPRITQVTEELLDAVLPSGRMEVIRDLTGPLTSTVLSEFIGLPPMDGAQLTEWAAGLAGFLTGTVFVDATQESDRRALQCLDALTNCFKPLLEARRKGPSEKDDLLGALVRVGQESDGLTPDEVLIGALMLMIGSFLVIPGALANCILGLARHPDQFQKLRENPALLEPAVEELLRYESLVQFSPRRASQDFEFGGQRIGRDQTVFVGLGSSNRDESRFEHPDELDIARAGYPHLAFGYGPHACIGERLGRLHLRGAIQVLARRVTGLSLEADRVVWNGGPMFRSFESLPLTVTT
jgi:cytochrome P450